jgi:hypothetical protein
MADSYASLEQGLKLGLSDLFGNERVVATLDRSSRDRLVEAGRRAVHLAIAPFLWDEKLGQMLDTGEVTDRLGVSRQAVAKAVDAGRLIALPAGKTRRFPIWQFSFTDHLEIRPQVAELVAAFREVYPEVHPLQIAGWARTPQPELDGISPEVWLDEAGDLEPALVAARRTASALAQ